MTGLRTPFARLIATAAAIVATVITVPAIASLMSDRATDAGSLSLDPAAPAFTVSGLIPGDYAMRCFKVGNDGDGTMNLAEGLSVAGDLAPYLKVAVEQGTGSGGACADFVPASGIGRFVYGTAPGGVTTPALKPATTEDWPAHSSKTLRITILLPSEAPLSAAAKTANVTLAFAGEPLDGGTTTPDLPGGIAPGTTGGYDAHGNFLTNSQIKKRLKIGKARLLKNGDVVVTMFLPAGGAIRAKVILPNGVYYAHTLLPEEWGPRVRILLKRRDIGRIATVNARRAHRSLVTRVTTRYRWAHGPDAFVQPEQKLTIVKKR